MNLNTSLRLCAAIFLLMLAACKKDQLEPEGPLGNNIKSLNLKSISFTPSTNALFFNSTAFGREINGMSPSIALGTWGWTHPSVLYFENKWNNYNYWAALTPYPDIDSQYENPHIFCSNDGITWIEPRGILNPIERCPTEGGFNSDVNLMMDNDLLYCYWRATEPKERVIYVRSSNDGIHWGEKKLVCKMPFDVVDVISPTFLKDEDKYYCYAVCGKETTAGGYFNNYAIRRMISLEATEFKPEKNSGFDLINIEGRPWGANQEPWHIEVRKLKNIWMLLVTTTTLDAYGSGGRLFMGYSTDGITFKFNDQPICSAVGSSYKSSFNPSLDAKNKKINVHLWRAMMSYGWAVFSDNFSIKVN